MVEENRGSTINKPVIKLDLNEDGAVLPVILKDAIVHVSYLGNLKVKIHFKDGEIDNIEQV